MEPINLTQPTSSVIQPITPQIPEQPAQPKSNPSKWIIVIVVVLLLLVVSGVSAYILNKNSIPKTQITIKTNSVLKITTLTPEENSLYLGTYQGKDALFITDKDKEVYYEKDAPKTSKYIGKLSFRDSGLTVFDFRNLVNPKKILSNSKLPINDINNFILDDSKNVAYVSVNYLIDKIKYPGMLNSILQIKTDGSSVSAIWSNNIGSDKYPKAKGMAAVDKAIDDKYVSSTIYNCFGCSPSPVGTIILNVNTKNEKFIEMIGDLQFNLQNNTFTYKKLFYSEEGCKTNPEPYCGQYKTTGDILTDSLP